MVSISVIIMNKIYQQKLSIYIYDNYSNKNVKRMYQFYSCQYSRTQGYSGPSYDKWVERTETSTLHKMKETFWTTKQAVMQKLGKKEDEHVVASDSELDSKLEVSKRSWRNPIRLYLKSFVYA